MAAVTLFGSRARGEAAPESDWDLLVIAKNLPERVMKHHALLKGLVPDIWHDSLSILVRTPQDLESHLPALYLEIALDGIVLFDTDGYLAQRLAKLRAAIERLGLERLLRQRNIA
ncbi:nucleotidyltransferase domain-containing protein [Roseiflexus sp.]|uniref:nucleotidyltransferase domain-containing protein n=1 Tax=Roseiflexus sp. TaxID=2562120 RepID=UPI00398B1785